VIVHVRDIACHSGAAVCPKLGHVWPRSSSFLNYWFALLSVAAAFACVSLLEHVLKANPPVSLFLCAIELVQLEIAKLTMPKRNVRNAEQSHIVQVANSIRILGFCSAVLIDQYGWRSWTAPSASRQPRRFETMPSRPSFGFIDQCSHRMSWSISSIECVEIPSSPNPGMFGDDTLSTCISST
jgi:hypothetical protein